MKIYKFNESYNKYNIGDYVVVKEDTINRRVRDFYENNIGQIIEPTKEMINQWDPPYQYYVKFKKIPDNIHIFFYKDTRPYNNKDILFASPDKKIVKTYLTARKYNL